MALYTERPRLAGQGCRAGRGGVAGRVGQARGVVA